MTAASRKLMTAALALAMAWVLAGAPSARGAEYKVTACGPSAGNQNHLLAASMSESRMSAYTACPNDGSGHYVGVAALAGINVGTVPVFANATQTFSAPTGTTIRHLRINADGRTWNGNWAALLQASNDGFARNASTLVGCNGRPDDLNGCVAAMHFEDQNYDIPGTTAIRTVVACARFAGCTTFSTDLWPYTRAYYFVHEFDVTLDDPSLPTVSVVGGGLAGSGWLRGTHSIAFNASDNTGIRRTRFWVDDLGHLNNDLRGCDYTYAVPCSNLNGGQYGLDTTRLSDGEHRIAVDAFDATDSNWNNDLRTIRVDNHAPAEAAAAAVIGGEGWRTTNAFSVRWDNPPSAAPIERAYYELCRAGGSSCSVSSQASTGISRLQDVHVPQPGDYTIRVWLADAAGNVSEAKTAPMHLKFDNVPPAQAQPQHRNGWVNKEDAKHVDQQIDPPVAATPPVSGIAGYAVTTNGASPGGTVDTPTVSPNNYTAHKTLRDLPEGTTTVKARAISGAGVASRDVGSTDIYADLTPPVVSAEGAPGPDEWSRSPVELRVVASDPGHLSGMAGGPPDRGPDFGGAIRYSIDGGNFDSVRGPQRELGPDGRLGFAASAAADITVTSDGAHTVGYAGTDVAGNDAVEATLSFKIDRTPPELVVFEPQQATDPRLVSVAASDRTSGVADGGRIELRRVSPTRGDWISLHTTRDGDHYHGHIDNTRLPDGDYEFRAIVPDEAGNVATGTTNRDGQQQILHISPTEVGPYRTGGNEADGVRAAGPEAQDAKATIATKITAIATQRQKARKKCKRVHGRRRCTYTPASVQMVHELRVPFGTTVAVQGTLTTDAGQPLADTEVTVLARPATANASYAAEASVRTDAQGGFRYRAPAGASRTLDFHYRGNDRYKHADDQVILRVPASATLRVARHVVRNGRRVLFSGNLRGLPLPPKGKLVDLQAYYRGKWRTFATPRASRNGAWRYRYRFQATRGVVIYKFRVRSRATSDYPYELGYSGTIRVRVIGR